MCLLLLAWRSVPGCAWLLLGNRDELHARPSAPAAPWDDAPAVVGGRDLAAGGSWMALARDGRFAAVTNVRGAARPAEPRSRGRLVRDFLVGERAPGDYVAAVAGERHGYGPFNLVVGDAQAAWFVSSIDGAPRPLAPGVHAFSNGGFADEWPKMRRLRAGFAARVAAGLPDDAALLALLADATLPPDDELPDTGVGVELERRLAPIFVRGPVYGTRSSTLAYRRDDGALHLRERRFGPDAQPLGEAAFDL